MSSVMVLQLNSWPLHSVRNNGPILSGQILSSQNVTPRFSMCSISKNILMVLANFLGIKNSVFSKNIGHDHGNTMQLNHHKEHTPKPLPIVCILFGWNLELHFEPSRCQDMALWSNGQWQQNNHLHLRLAMQCITCQANLAMNLVTLLEYVNGRKVWLNTFLHLQLSLQIIHPPHKHIDYLFVSHFMTGDSNTICHTWCNVDHIMEFWVFESLDRLIEPIVRWEFW